MIDRLDAKILNIVQRNNRITVEQLGAEIGLSPSACQRRRFGCADVLREAAARSEAAARWRVGGVRTVTLELDRARRQVGIAHLLICTENWSEPLRLDRKGRNI